MLAHSAVGEVHWGMPRVAIRSKRRPRGNREQVRLHGHGFVSTGPKEIPRIFAPLAWFRKILSCSVSLRRCAAVYKIAPPPQESLVPMPEILVPRLAA
jgi:hypothetical protein